MNDVIAMWVMLFLSGRTGQDSIVLNMDGVRRGGPAGCCHRVMDKTNPDNHGPFRFYFDSWFQNTTKGTDYKRLKVCFSDFYIPVFPGIPYVWSDYDVDNNCSMIGPSTMYQQFSLFVRKMMIEKFDPGVVMTPPKDSVHVIFLQRKAESSKSVRSSSRRTANVDEVIESISKLPGVSVSMHDFSEINFLEQYKIASSSSIILSMHGAAINHIFHTSIGTSNCCAVIEMFPTGVEVGKTFTGIRVFGNLARHLGVHYFRFENDPGMIGRNGSTLAVERLIKIVSLAVESVRTNPSCLRSEALSSTI